MLRYFIVASHTMPVPRLILQVYGYSIKFHDKNNATKSFLK